MQKQSRRKILESESIFLQKFKDKISFIGPKGLLEPFVARPSSQQQSKILKKNNSSQITRRSSIDRISNKQNNTRECNQRPSSESTILTSESSVVLKLPRIRSRSIQSTKTVQSETLESKQVELIEHNPGRRYKNFARKQKKLVLNQQYQNIISKIPKARLLRM